MTMQERSFIAQQKREIAAALFSYRLTGDEVQNVLRRRFGSSMDPTSLFEIRRKVVVDRHSAPHKHTQKSEVKKSSLQTVLANLVTVASGENVKSVTLRIEPGKKPRAKIEREVPTTRVEEIALA